MAVEGMKGSTERGWEAADDEEPRSSCVGAGDQVSMSFPASSLGEVIADGFKG
jgi:hypothetical protein